MAKSKARFLADVLQDDGSSIFVGNFAVPADFVIDPAGSPTGLGNASLENSSITINSYDTALGSSVTLVTDDINEGGSPTNLYFTNARAQAAFTGGTGVTITSGEVAIGQSVGTTDNVTFNQVTATVPYDNSVSGLTATNVQSAITELNTLLGGGNVGSQATYNVYEYTTAGNDTQFDLSALSPAGSYVPGYVQVYLNGLLLSESDYTAVDGSTINFSPAITNAGQLLYIIAYDSFNTAEILRVTSIDASASTNSITLDANDDLSLTGSLSFADNEKAIFGADSDLQIYHDALNSYVQNSTGNLILKNATADYFRGVLSTGAAELYYAGSSTLTTTSTGIDVTGTVTADGLTVDGDVNIDDAVPILRLDSPEITWSGGEDLGGIDWYTKDPSSVGPGVMARIYSESTGANTLPIPNLIFQTSLADLSLKDRMKIEGTGDISFYEDTGTTAKLFWDASAESLGIGTTSPVAPLTVSGNNFISWVDSAQGGVRTNEAAGTTASVTGYALQYKQNVGLGYHSWETSGNTTAGNALTYEEHMRIDSSGNVGVSTGNLNISPNTVKPWVAYHRGIDFGGDATPTYPYGSLSARVDYTELSNNFYNNASAVDIIANGAASPGLYASRFYQSNGGFAFQRSSNQATSDDTAVSSWITPFTLGSDNNVNFLGSLTLGDTSTGVGNLNLYDTGNNLLQLSGIGSNDFLVDLLGTSGIGTLKFNDFYVSIDVNSGTDALNLISSTTGTAGPQLDFTFEKAVPSNNDVVGRINFNGRDSDLNPTTYARIDGVSENVVNGAEQGKIIFSTRKSGSIFEEVAHIDHLGTLNLTKIDSTSRIVSNYMLGEITLTGGQNYPAGWYRIARSTILAGSNGQRGPFRVSIESTGGSLSPGQATITGHKNWTNETRISSVTTHGYQWFSKFRATVDADYAYLEGYFAGYTPSSTSNFITTVHGDTGYYSDTWYAYTENMTAGLSSPVNTSAEVITNRGQRAMSLYNLNISGDIWMNDGAGIDFNNVQSSAVGTTPTASATLDDYEEGAWTPTLKGSTGNPSGITWSGGSPKGRYTKIGRTVHIEMEIFASAITTDGTGGFSVGGLPFDISTEGSWTGLFVSFGEPNVERLVSAATNVQALGVAGTDTFRLYKNNLGTAGMDQLLWSTDIASEVRIRLTGAYSADT